MILHLALKDLKRRLRTPLGTIILLIFPIAFAVLIGITFGREGKMTPVKIALIDFDGGFFSRLPANAMSQDEMSERFELFLVTRSEWQADFEKLAKEKGTGGESLYDHFMGLLEHEQSASVDPDEDGGHAWKRNPAQVWISDVLIKNDCSALLIMPKGFSEAVIAGEETSLLLYKNPSQGIYPLVAENLADILTRLLSIGVEVLQEPFRAINNTVLADDGLPPESSFVEVSRLFSRSFRRIKKYIMPEGAAFGTFQPLISVRTVSESEEPAAAETESDMQAAGKSMTLQIILVVFPGIGVLALMMIADMVMRDIRIEYERKTLTRQLVAPLNTGTVIGGKMLSTFLISTICLVILALVTLSWKPGPVSLTGVAVLSFCFILATVGFSALIYSIAGSSRQGAVISSIILMPMGFLGGSFLPLDMIRNSFLGAVSPYTLNFWAIDGYLKLLTREAGPADILTQCGILLAVGVVFLFAGAMILKRRVASRG